MTAQASFQQILEEKIKAKASRENVQTASTLNSTDPAHLAYLLGNLSVSYWQPRAQSIYPAGPRPTPKPHALSQDQQIAYDFFNSCVLELGPVLAPAFTRRDLKRGFRTLALKLHPDIKKGPCGPFIALKKHYETLSALFSS